MAKKAAVKESLLIGSGASGVTVMLRFHTGKAGNPARVLQP